MIKACYLMQRKAGMSQEAFSAYWKETHGPIVAAVPGLRKYVQNHAQATPDGNVFCDGIAEMWFDDMASFGAGMGSDQGRALLEDARNFVEIEKSGLVLVDEIEVL